MDCSRPRPDSLMPPNGAAASVMATCHGRLERNQNAVGEIDQSVTMCSYLPACNERLQLPSSTGSCRRHRIAWKTKERTEDVEGRQKESPKRPGWWVTLRKLTSLQPIMP